MGFKEEILKYEPKTKTNITEFDIIRFEDITAYRQETFEFDKGPKTKWVVTLKGMEVIVPDSVMSDLKLLLKNMQLKAFKVIKEGEGIKTKYKVIPIEGISYGTPSMGSYGDYSNIPMEMGPYGRN